MILTSDIHLDNKKENEYRWGIFPLLHDLVEDDKNNEEQGIYVLGDLTVAKDKHPNELLDRIATELIKLSEKTNITIISGNHDYTNPDYPVLNHLDSLKGITFYKKPTKVKDIYYLPHSFTPEEEWNSLDFSEVDLIFMHQTVQGSLGDNGVKLKGIDLSFFTERGFGGTLYSGDVHTPQTVENLVYLGSPYHINFGSSFEPRLLMADTHASLRKKDYREIVAQFPRKITVEISEIKDLDKFSIKENDFIKCKFRMSQDDKIQWREHKKEVQEKLNEIGAVLSSFDIEIINEQTQKEVGSDMIELDNTAVFDRYVKQEGVSKFLTEVGVEFLR